MRVGLLGCGLGFEAIDLWTAHLSPGWASDEHLAIARALLEGHDLTVVSLAGGFGGTPEELRATCRVAHAVGTDLLAGSLRLLTADRDAVVAILQGEGIRLGVENHPDERTPADLLRKIGDGADGHIGAALDTGWWVTNGFDPVAAVHHGRLLGADRLGGPFRPRPRADAAARARVARRLAT